ncbi:MAG: hypothetical protein RR797_05150 [Christensenella sp.]
MARSNEKKQKSKKSIIILVVIIVILVAVGGWFGYQYWRSTQSTGFELDEMAKNGFFKDKTDAEIQDLLNQVVDDGMFNISINSNPVFENGSAEGNLRIENVPNNHYYMTVKISLDDTGEVVYESKGLKQEQFIETAKLTKVLAAGNYPATAVFTAVDPDTLKEVGTAAAKINIFVLN